VPIRFVIDRVLQRMVTQADGLVTYAELNEHLNAEERERGLGLPELIDATFATTDVKTGDVVRLVQRAARTSESVPLGPTAIVVQDSVAFGMARMYSILMDRVGAPVGVFRDHAEAISWLKNISSPT
jgi:hypothetical protein